MEAKTNYNESSTNCPYGPLTLVNIFSNMTAVQWTERIESAVDKVVDLFSKTGAMALHNSNHDLLLSGCFKSTL